MTLNLASKRLTRARWLLYTSTIQLAVALALYGTWFADLLRACR